MRSVKVTAENVEGFTAAFSESESVNNVLQMFG